MMRFFDHPEADGLRRLLHWAKDAPRRTQTVAVGVILDRDLMGWRLEQFKGTLRIDLGCVFVELGG